MKRYTALVTIAATLLTLFAVWLWGYHCGNKLSSTPSHAKDSQGCVSNGTAVADTATVSKTIPAPAFSSERQTGVITIHVYLDPSPIQDSTVPNLPIIINPDSLKADTVSADTARFRSMPLAALQLPKTQRIYTDTAYTAYVSGYQPTLDSLKIRSMVITNTITKTKYRKINFGITAGAGYGIFMKKPDIFIGFGLTVNLYRH